MLRFLSALMVTLRHGWEWLVLHATGRDLAGERAQRLQARLDAQAEDNRRVLDEARHEEMMAATEQQTAESRRLRQAIEAAAKPVVRGPTVAQRRAEIQAQSRSHDVEIRSSTWGAESELQDEAAIALDRAG